MRPITIVDAGRLMIDFSENGDGPGEVFRESRKVYVQIIAAIADVDEPQYGDALRRLAHRYWAEGEAMAVARIATPAAPRPGHFSKPAGPRRTPTTTRRASTMRS